MVKIDTFPSLKKLGEEVVADPSGQLIQFCFPTARTWAAWQDSIVLAINSCLVEAGRDSVHEVIKLNADSSEPSKDFLELVGYDEPACHLQDAITSYGADPPIVLVLDCNGTFPDAWKIFLSEIARYYQKSDKIYANRSMCLFVINPGLYPPIKIQPGVRCFSFWNPLRWEEVRIIIDESLPYGENNLTRSWALSTYTGAANSDLNAISALLSAMPTTLNAVKKTIYDLYEDIAEPHDIKTYTDVTFGERRWEVPANLVSEWLKGRIYGNTLERGPLIPLERCEPDTFNEIIDRSIWREQVAGLYPLLMEITFLTSNVITKKKGALWKSHLPAYNGSDSLQTEPAEILSVFKENKVLGWLPEKIYQILIELRFVRNQLAHLQPIDYRNIRQIGSLLNQISQY